jgi:hypothetical protein
MERGRRRRRSAIQHSGQARARVLWEVKLGYGAAYLLRSPGLSSYKASRLGAAIGGQSAAHFFSRSAWISSNARHISTVVTADGMSAYRG